LRAGSSSAASPEFSPLFYEQLAGCERGGGRSRSVVLLATPPQRVQPPELSLLEHQASPMSGEPEALDTFEAKNVASYLDQVLRLL
jgi:hypothetical protein